MFRPLEMVRVVLQVLHSDAAKVTHVVAKQGLFHLLDSRQFSKFAGQGKVGGEAFQMLMNRYSTLDQELQNLFQTLSIHRTLRKDSEVEPAKEIDVIEDNVKRIRRDLSNLSEQLEQLEQQRQEKTRQLQLLRSIAASAPDLETIRKFTYFYRAVGFMATKDIPRFQVSLESIHVVLVPLTTIEHRTLIAVLCSPRDQDILERALKSAYFERIALPDIAQGTIEDVITRLDAELSEIVAKKIALSQELQHTQADIIEELQRLREKVSLALLILKAELYYGKGARSYVILGWIPKMKITAFEEEIMSVTEGRARFDVSEPEFIEEVQQGKIKIPILFNNPLLIKPFESVVFNYGTQDYREIDPTPIVAITFLLMFGMMFGDVGHGMVLFALGYWLFKKFYQLMDYGIITMECGVSSAIFGFLYGSIFGAEHVLPAIWLRPSENIDTFMKFAIGLGVVMISTGVILNIINSFHRKDYESGILGHYGIVGGLFYWIVVGLGLKYAVYGNLGMDTKVLLLVLAVPLGIIFFKEPLAHVLFHHEHTGEKLFPSGFGMFLMEAAIDVMDIVIRYLASTVSFVRTAAFALAHGGLFIAVFSLAEILRELRGGGLWYWLVILLGNVGIIALEGLVVSIQTIRLEYYEFFSKFFKGGGERFQPLKME